MSNPYQSPKSIVPDVPEHQRSLRGLFFIPFGILSQYAAFLSLAMFFMAEDSLMFHSTKFWAICTLAATLSGLALVFLRVRSIWILTVLMPPISLFLFMFWVTLENFLTGTMSW
jgi:hypothetical protein